MRSNQLSQYFTGVAAKRLTRVEVDPESSNQHEFQGVGQLRQILGTPTEKVTFDATFMRLDDAEKSETINGFVTWSDVRRDNPNRSAEYHLYYAATADPIVHAAEPGDLLVIATRTNGSVLVIIVPSGSTTERQLLWLFGLSVDAGVSVSLRHVSRDDDVDLGFAGRAILEAIGVEVSFTDESWLDRLLERFGDDFPSTAVFSAFARETAEPIQAAEAPDDAIVLWMEHEEMLFRTLENHLVSRRLETGFDDVDDFIGYSLSIQNRRKARAGLALENHLEQIFVDNGVRYTRGAETENKSRPDFIFPGIPEYHDPSFPADRLTMLGVKSTCKDRWRQVLAEAARIQTKHLFTLEAAISENQTAEMALSGVTLVLPVSLHLTYTRAQRHTLLNLEGFIRLTRRMRDSFPS